MADFSPSTISLKCPSSESTVLYNDQPQSGLIDEVARTEFITYTN
jgi:hypothetical protein